MVADYGTRMKIKLILLGVAFWTGWTVRGWQVKSVELAILHAAQATAATWSANETELAKTVNEKLQGLRANERIIEKRIPQIVDRPIYNVECVDHDGLRIINGDNADDNAGRPNVATDLPGPTEVDSNDGHADNHTGSAMADLILRVRNPP